MGLLGYTGVVMYKNIFKTEVGEEALDQAKSVHSAAGLEAAVEIYDALFDELNRLFERGKILDKEKIYQVLRFRSRIVRLVCLPVEDTKLLAVVNEAKEYLDRK